MPLDHKWVVFAGNDVQTAEVLLREGIWNQVCFHSQQAAEKYLKSLIDPEIRPRSHKIAVLIPLCDPQLPPELKREMLLLDRFYIPARYPDALPGALEEALPGKSDAEGAFAAAMKLKSFVGSL